MLVSIITPVYNRSDTITRAMQSVSEQSYNPIEHIIVNDGSTDDTGDVITKSKYNNINYIEHTENHGVSAARNTGIEAANGRFVLFVDSDDELRESAISTLVNELRTEPEDCAGVFGQDYYKNKGDGSPSTYNSSTVEYSDLASNNPMGAIGGKLLRRRLFNNVGGFDPSFPSSEDFDLYVRIAQNGYYFKYVDEPVYNKYRHEGQLYADTYEKITGMRQILEKHGDKLTPQHRVNRMRIIGHTYARKNQPNEASYWFRKCIFLCPSQPIYYIYYILSKLHLYTDVSNIKNRIQNRS